MAADVHIAPPEPGDAAALFSNLRASDLAECQAYGTTDIGANIASSVDRSVVCWAVRIDGKLAAIMGCAPLNILAGVGSPWMLGTPVLDRHQRILMSRAPEYISRMLELFPHLLNFVHTDNTKSVRWLRRLGFHVGPAQPYARLGELFHRFELRADRV